MTTTEHVPRRAPESSGDTRVLVIGLGNPYRRDDGAGLAVAACVQAAGLPGVQVQRIEGEPLTALDLWEDAAVVYLVDAVFSAKEAGAVHRFDVASGMPPAPLRHRGTHTFSLADVVELGRALDRLPGRLVIYGIEGADFAAGTDLSPQAAEGVGAVSAQLIRELATDGGGR